MPTVSGSVTQVSSGSDAEAPEGRPEHEPQQLPQEDVQRVVSGGLTVQSQHTHRREHDPVAALHPGDVDHREGDRQCQADACGVAEPGRPQVEFDFDLIPGVTTPTTLGISLLRNFNGGTGVPGGRSPTRHRARR